MQKLVRPPDAIADLNDRAFRSGVPIADVLKRAGVAFSTWMRWRRGVAAKPETIDRCNAALQQIITERTDGAARQEC